MKMVKVEFTLEELRLLAAVASDQLFRREFIDPKMPGYKADAEELALGKELVLRLKSIAKEASPGAGAAARRAPSHLSPGANGGVNAV